MDASCWRIRKARNLVSLSQSGLAGRVGVQRSAVTQWEREGGTLPSVGHLMKIALETGVSFEWLATGRGSSQLGSEAIPAVMLDDYAQDELESRALALLRRLPARKREVACSMIELLAR